MTTTPTLLPMTWITYRELALKTEAIPTIRYESIVTRDDKKPYERRGPDYEKERTRATRLMHAAAGLVTETDELINFDGKTNFIEELGDCFWYLPIIEQVLDFTYEPLVSVMPGVACTRKMAYHAAALIDQCLKRHIIYGKELDVGIVKEHYCGYVDALYSYLFYTETKVAEVWTANIEKLKKRYPDGRFDVVATSNRDVEKELSHIKESLGEENQKVVPPTLGLTEKALISLDEMQARVDAMPDEPKSADWIKSYYGQQIEKNIFIGLFWEVVPKDKRQTMVAEWARQLALKATEEGAHWMAEGYKTAYNKILCGKPESQIDLEAWYIFQLLPNAPVAVEEVEAWLRLNH